MTIKKAGKRFRATAPHRFLVPVLVLALSAGGCGGGNRGGGKQDAASGGRAAVPAAERIISTAPSNTEIIAALGFADRIIAMDKYSAGAEGVTGSPVLIDFAYPDGEVILGLEPDIVFAAGHNETVSGSDPFRLVRETGIPVIFIPTSVSIAGIYRDIGLIAEALGVPERGEKLAADMRAEIEGVTKTCSAVTEKQSVYFEISPFPYMVTFGRETYLNEMITVIGGVNIFAGEKSWFSPSPEAVIGGNPDVILTLAGSGGAVREIQSRPGFGVVKAVKNNRIYSIDADAASRPSHRIVFALKQMARAVYPDLFPAF
jgi:iron complex transport system substrate-binding protein